MGNNSPYHERLKVYPLGFGNQLMSGARHANFNRALVLSLLMIMMTQVGYLESMNSLTNSEETLDESNDVLETGGSGSSFAYANDKVSAGDYHTCLLYTSDAADE